MNTLKEKIEQEIDKINASFDTVKNEVAKSFQLKREKLDKEENDLLEKLQNEVTKVKEKLENYFTECNNLILACARINKGIKKNENNGNNNISKGLSYISEMNKIKKDMTQLDNELIRNIKITFEEEKTDINFENYFFNGCPILKNIEFTDIQNTSFKVNWKLDGGHTNDNTNKFKFRIEIKKEKDDNNNYSLVYEGNDDNYLIKGLSQDTIYEIRLSLNYDNFIIPLGQIQKVQTSRQIQANLFGNINSGNKNRIVTQNLFG